MSTPDQILAARIDATATRLAQVRDWTAERKAAASAELRKLAGGRVDLLTAEAGVALGFGEGHPDAGRYSRMAELLIAAGADQAATGQWVEVGRRRAEAAKQAPYAGG